MGKITEEEHCLTQLTHKAMEAAAQGKWDSVAQIYDRRAHAGSLSNVSEGIAKKLIQSDEWIMTRIREVQTLTQQQLGDVQQQRRSLEGLKRQWASHGLTQARHRLSI